MYKGTMFESALRLQKAYEEPLPQTAEYLSPREKRQRMKGSLACKKFPPCTPKHNTTKVSFEENERRLKEIDNDPIWKEIGWK